MANTYIDKIVATGNQYITVLVGTSELLTVGVVDTNIADPDPNPDPDLPGPRVFGPPGSGPLVRGMDPDPDPAPDPDPSIIKQK